MKRLILAAVASSMLAMPVVQAQAAPKHQPQNGYSQNDQQWKKKPSGHVVRKPVVIQKKVIVRKPHMSQPRWKSGQQFSGWKKYQSVKDYNRYHLRRPAHGQQWVRVGNDYILVSILSGVIASIVAAN